MRIPVVSGSTETLERLQDACAQAGGSCGDPGWERMVSVPLQTATEALEYINYQTPPLLVVDFADDAVDGFGLIDKIVEDPWLNHGAIIALFSDSATLERINELIHTNIVFSLADHDVPSEFPAILEVVQRNRQILFQRAVQKELLADISGHLLLENRIALVPLYANLVANYLFNMDFIDPARKTAIRFALTEVLINAVEHGNCGIGSEEKERALDAGQSVPDLIETKLRDPEIAARRVHFSYSIHPTHSVYTVRDEGDGFDWRTHLQKVREDDMSFLLAERGRGIWMTHQSVDRLEYNDTGNLVTLRVDHRRNVSNTLPLGFEKTEQISLSPGDIVFREGEESTFLYYIAEGEFSVQARGRELSVMNPADLLMGEMSFLLEEYRSATVIAKTHGRLLKISKEAFVDSIKNKPYYGLFLARLLAQRLNRLTQRFGD